MRRDSRLSLPRIAAIAQPLFRALCLCLLAVVAACSPLLGTDAPSAETRRLPNIVILYADDLGYGDVGAYGARAIATPHMDALAARGVRFTDAHASAATCTPSRYSLLTGEHGFRARAGILPGDAPALIRPGKATIASMLKGRGYATGVVGKWHLGLGDGSIDWNRRIAPGPAEIGFDYSFLIPATADRVPTVWVEDQRVVALDPADPLRVSYKERVGDRPVGFERPDLLRQPADRTHGESIVNGISRIGYMAGGKSAEWVDEAFPDVITGRAERFIEAYKTRPFFLYVAFPEPHVPRLPAARFQGKTDLGPRGDAIVQLDWMVGRIVRALRERGLERDTLILLSSDNGPILFDGYEDGARERNGAHRPAGPFRGSKYSAYEGGTRVPTILAWPGTVKPGTSDALLSQMDLFASIARLVGAPLADDVAIDSRDLLDVWLGRSTRGRDTLLLQGMRDTALRQGTIKFIPAVSGPVRSDESLRIKNVESGAQAEPQIYDLASDLGERRNLAAGRDGDVAAYSAVIASIRQRTRAAR